MMKLGTSGSQMSSVARILTAEIAANFQRLVQPSTIAIYASHGSRPDTPVQVGTGFLVKHQSRPVLITAKHVLRGHGFNYDPAEKAVHINGRWVYVGDGARTLVEPKGRDLSVMFMDEFSLDRCLDAPNSVPIGSAIITMGGYLCRDFKRSGNTLRPAPRVYTNVAAPAAPGMIGLRHPKRRNVNTSTGVSAVSPTPRGLSGGPMVDSLALLKGAVVLSGVLTEMSNGSARGEDVGIITQAIAAL